MQYFAFSAVKWLIIHTEYKTKHVEIIWSLKTHDLNTAKIQGGLGKLWGRVLELSWVITCSVMTGRAAVARGWRPEFWSPWFLCFGWWRRTISLFGTFNLQDTEIINLCCLMFSWLQSFLIEPREKSYIYKITCPFIHSLIISQKKSCRFFKCKVQTYLFHLQGCSSCRLLVYTGWRIIPATH